MRSGSMVALSAGLLLTAGFGAVAQTPKGRGQAASGANPALVLSRKSLANSARFTVTSTVAPVKGTKSTDTFRVEVSGAKLRLEYNNDMLGAVSYLINEKGVYLYIPANKAAQKQNVSGGIDGALKLAFQSVVEPMRGAIRTGTANVSGQPTDVYKNDAQGTTIYWGKNPGFRLPVKMEIRNEGGVRTLTASNIVLNEAIPAARFSLPSGTQVIESQGAPGGLPGLK